MAKDLHESQAIYSNRFTEPIPVLGSLVRLTNVGVSGVFQGLHLGAKVALKDPGRKLNDYADSKKAALKERKLKAMEMESEDEETDAATLDESYEKDEIDSEQKQARDSLQSRIADIIKNVYLNKEID